MRRGMDLEGDKMNEKLELYLDLILESMCLNIFTNAQLLKKKALKEADFEKVLYIQNRLNDIVKAHNRLLKTNNKESGDTT